MTVRPGTNPRGYLRLRIYWRGKEYVVGTKLRDDAGRNVALVRAKATLIEQKLDDGIELHRALLSVLGDCPPTLLPKDRGGGALSVSTFLDEWLTRLDKKRMRKSYLDRARTYVKSVIRPFWDGVRLVDVDEAAVEDFQVHVLAREKGDGEPISVKTAKNIVSGLFAAIVRDARRRYRLPERDPFEAIIWTEIRREDPDPFLSGERDRILGFYWNSRRRWYPFVAFLFWTGLRPSEAVALRVGDYDRGAGTLRVTKSRTEGEDRATKTRASVRTIRLFPEAIHALESLPSRPFEDPEAFLFESAAGTPINQREWPKKSFYPVLERLGIRRRKFYATRHAFITELIGRGETLKAIAEYVGTSVAMIEQSYGRSIPKGGDGSIRSLGMLEGGRFAGRSEIEERLTGTNDLTMRGNLKMVPRGIEGSDDDSSDSGEPPQLGQPANDSSRSAAQGPKHGIPQNRRTASETSGRRPPRGKR